MLFFFFKKKKSIIDKNSSIPLKAVLEVGLVA